MTVAISEILKQVAFLSPAEQQELAARLTEQVGQNAEAMPVNGNLAAALSDSPQGSASEGAEEANWLDQLNLQLMPLNQVKTARVQLRFVGRLEPLPFDFNDYFNDEEG